MATAVQRRGSTALARERVDCEHCGLPVPPPLVDEAAEHQFCCSGCETVFLLLDERGLRSLHERVTGADTALAPPRTTSRTYAELDDEGFAAEHIRWVAHTDEGTPALGEVTLYLEGVHCIACVWLVEKLPRILDGVVGARLDMVRQVAEIRFDPRSVGLSRVARTLDTLGYPVRPYRRRDQDVMRRQEDRALMTRIGIAGAAAGNVMLMAFALYSASFDDMSDAVREFIRWGSMCVAVPAVAWSGSVFFKGAFASLRLRTLHMDLPVAVAIFAGLVWGTANVIRGVGEIYFDTVALLVFLLLVGRWLTRRRQRQAIDAAARLMSLTPAVARRITSDGRTEEVAVSALEVGDRVQVFPGETIAVDGTVAQGQTAVDQALLTGESVPVDVSDGDTVFAGTTNVSEPIVVVVARAGESTRMARLMKDVEALSTRRAPIVRLADRWAARFVATVLTLAVVCLVGWSLVDLGLAVEHTVALLVVACPCALGLATPLAVSAAIGRAARRGLLIRGGDALEGAATPGTLWLDKTGTLTEGRMAVQRWWGPQEVRGWVARLERDVPHPVARALADMVPSAEGALDALVMTSGGGVEGGVEGRRLVVGSPRFVGERAETWGPDVRAELERAAEDGLTAIAVAVDGIVVGGAAVGDTLRDDSKATVAALQEEGWTVGILSGDDERVVRSVGRRLGISEARCLGARSPEDKLTVVQRSLADGPVMMVGDGVNDSAALAAATVGVAVHGGAEASLLAADVFTSTPGLAPVLDLVVGARQTVRVIHRNLKMSASYNAIGASLALAGVVGPLIAAVLMPISSLSVITSSHAARSFRTGHQN